MDIINNLKFLQTGYALFFTLIYPGIGHLIQLRLIKGTIFIFVVHLFGRQIEINGFTLVVFVLFYLYVLFDVFYYGFILKNPYVKEIMKDK